MGKWGGSGGTQGGETIIRIHYMKKYFQDKKSTESILIIRNLVHISSLNSIECSRLTDTNLPQIH